MARTSNSGDLPEDLTREILLRLPVKTLLQFKSVCKNWYALIESPFFVDRHFNHGSNKEHLLIGNYQPDTVQYTLVSYSDDETFCGLELPLIGSLLGPLNGIFCSFNIKGQMALLNPATKQTKPLPLVYWDNLPVKFNLHGFGLDPLTGHYKVVLIKYVWNHTSLLHVYNSGSDSWRQFEDLDFVNSCWYVGKSLCNTFLEGVYYWLILGKDSDIVILAFDMSLETFREIQAPELLNSKKGYLALYDDSLALLSCDMDMIEMCVDVWVMQEEGCWIKLFTIGPFQDIKWPLGFWKESTLLMETRTSNLTMCALGSKKLTTLEARKKGRVFYRYWVFSYKESLVSVIGSRKKTHQLLLGRGRVKKTSTLMRIFGIMAIPSCLIVIFELQYLFSRWIWR